MEFKEYENFSSGSDENSEPKNAKDEFEDISSSSTPEEFIDISSLSSFAESKKYEKKKRGPFAAIGRWWKKMKTWKKTLILVFTSLFLIVGLFIGSVFVFPQWYYNYDNNFTDDFSELGVDKIIDDKIINIALFGIDTRNPKSFSGNSDSIMILSLNTETKKVKIISVMRDSLVPIEKDGTTYYQKINSAYAKSPETAVKTLNKVFGLDIREYATVNFFGMVDIIDAVGGIDAELTVGEVSMEKDRLNYCIKNICKQIGKDPTPHYIKTAGKHHLNGIQAVAYSRIRKTSNIWGTTDDYGRTDRQRYVMEQLFNKALKIEKSQYMSLISALLPCSKTSLSSSEIYDLAVSILLHSPKFEQTRMPLKEYLMSSPRDPRIGSVVYYDLDYAKDIVHAFIYDDISPEDYMKDHPVQKNDWYSQKVGYIPPANNSGGKEEPDEPENPTPDDEPETPDGGDVTTPPGTEDPTTPPAEDPTTPPTTEDPLTPPATEDPATPPVTE